MRANILGALALQRSLLFQNDASYQFEINTNRAAADDGSTVTVGSNTFQANYEGGGGNDLTLTVVP